MSDFSIYLTLGLEHIANIKAYDHMLFIVSLCAIFTLKEWKKVLILVTAFTIGHSLTLVLSVTDVIHINSDLIETLIPITILLTCIYNILVIKNQKLNFNPKIHYIMALFFGLIHGMGFANYLKTLLGGAEGIIERLFAFNIGIELGQIGIVIVYFFIYFLTKSIIKLKHDLWALGISGIAGVISIKLLIDVLF